LIERGANEITAICLLAAPEGIKALEEGIKKFRSSNNSRHWSAR